MQNRMAGTTDYRMQSLEDIRVDIVDWIKQAKEILNALRTVSKIILPK